MSGTFDAMLSREPQTLLVKLGYQLPVSISLGPVLAEEYMSLRVA